MLPRGAIEACRRRQQARRRELEATERRAMSGLVRSLAVGLLLALALLLLVGFALGSWVAWNVGSLRPVVPLAILLALGLSAVILARRVRLAREADGMGRALAVAVLGSVTSILCVAILELGLRWFSPAVTYERAKRRSPPIFAPSEIVPFVLKPGYRGPTMSRETGETVELSVNSLGYRGPEFTVRKEPGSYRILVLGDSFAANVAIPDDELYTVDLERQLNESPSVRCPVEVINAGWANGSSPDAYVAYMLQRGFELDPDLVLMQFFVLNDFKDLIENEVVERRGEMPLRVRSKARYVDDEGRLRRIFDLKYRIPLLRDSHLFIHLWSLFGLEPVGFELASLLFADFAVDNFYQSADGIRPEFVFLPQSQRPGLLQEAFARSLGYTRALHREAGRRNVDFVLFLVPTGAQISRDRWEAAFAAPVPDDWEQPNPQREIAESLRPEGVVILDPLPSYRQRARNAALYLGEHGNGHWSAEGNRFTAGLVRDFLLSFQPFVTKCATHGR